LLLTSAKNSFCWCQKLFLPGRFFLRKKRFLPVTGKNLPTLHTDIARELGLLFYDRWLLIAISCWWRHDHPSLVKWSRQALYLNSAQSCVYLRFLCTLSCLTKLEVRSLSKLLSIMLHVCVFWCFCSQWLDNVSIFNSELPGLSEPDVCVFGCRLFSSVAPSWLLVISFAVYSFLTCFTLYIGTLLSLSQKVFSVGNFLVFCRVKMNVHSTVVIMALDDFIILRIPLCNSYIFACL